MQHAMPIILLLICCAFVARIMVYYIMKPVKKAKSDREWEKAKANW